MSAETLNAVHDAIEAHAAALEQEGIVTDYFVGYALASTEDDVDGYVTIEIGSVEEIDGLCRSCFLPALWQAKLHTINDTAVTDAGTLTICDGCSDHRYGQ